MRLSHSPVLNHLRRLAPVSLICAACCSLQNACIGAEDIPHQIAKVVKELELELEPTKTLTYTRRGFTSNEGSPSRYLLQLESDRTVSVYYYGGRDKDNKRAYSQTYHHGKWDESRNSPAKDQRERWDADHPPMFEKENAAQPSRPDKLNHGDVGPSNPYRKVAVGDWLKYELKSEYGFTPLTSTCVVRVASVEGSVVKLIQTVTLDKGKEVNLDKTIDISKPLSLFELLGYDKPHEMRMAKVDEGRESLTVAGREVKTEWTQYDVGRGTLDPAVKRVWISQDVPLDGVVKRQSITKGLGGGIDTEVLVAFGSKATAVPSEKAASAERVTENRPVEINSLGMSLVKMQRGTFVMGEIPLADFYRLALAAKTKEDKLDLLGLTPPHRHAIIPRDYWIATKEVTLKQFRELIAATGYQTDAEKDRRGGTGRLPSGQFAQSPEFTWQNVGFPLHDDHPVVNVSWNDAHEFCQWLGKKEGAVYRLPSEAEWEIACRGGTTSRFSCGNQIKDLDGFANVADRSLAKVTIGLPWPAPFNDQVEYLAEVGSYKPNALGLYDMHGNALEWCHSQFSFSDPLENLELPVNPETQYCLKGGNWFNDPDRAGSACRSGAPPETRMSLIGFRVVRADSESSLTRGPLDAAPAPNPKAGNPAGMNPFDRAYANYRKQDFKAAKADLNVIPKAERHADAQALEVRIRFYEVFMARLEVDIARLKVEKTDKETVLLTNVSNTANAVRPIYLELVAITEKDPRSAVAQELLGEVANGFHSYLESYSNLLPSIAEIHATERKRMKAVATKAFQRSVELDASRAIPHVRLAGALFVQEGNYENPQIAEHLLQGVTNAPNDPACVKLLVIVMWSSSMLEDEQKKKRAQKALSGVTGESIQELKKAKAEVEYLLDDGLTAARRIAATGNHSPAVDNSIFRLRRALAVINGTGDR